MRVVKKERPFTPRMKAGAFWPVFSKTPSFGRGDMLSHRASSRLAFCSRFWGEVYVVRLTYAAGDGAGATEAMAHDAGRHVSGIITDPAYGGYGPHARYASERSEKKRGEQMDTSMNAAAQSQTAETRQAAQALSKWWWGWLVSGTLWILASI